MNNDNNQKITTPIAIIIAGVLIMIGIIISNNGLFNTNNQKTLSEQVGVNKNKFDKCFKSIDLEDFYNKIKEDGESAFSAIPENERGTPYSIIIGKNGVKAEIRGAYPKEEILKIIQEVKDGKISSSYQGEVESYKEGDHIMGDPDAEITIIEYSDLECPYCKKLSNTLKEIVDESDGSVSWIYRHWIIHQNAIAKAAAAECVAEIKGNDAFWKYIDLIFGLIESQDDTEEELVNTL